MCKQFFIIVLLLVGGIGLNAQNLEYKSVLTGNIGFSGIGTIIDVFNNNDLEEFDFDLEQYGNISGAFTGRSLPALQVNYDYGIAKWFSIGGGISYQRLNFNIRNLMYTDNDSGIREQVASLGLETSRINVTARILFHYANSKNLDLYSGIRLGVTNWLTTIDASDTSVQADLEDGIPFFGVVPTGQLIPFALRYYVNENLGFNFETGIGAPHFLAIGVNYRL